jgi:hypothetical protein
MIVLLQKTELPITLLPSLILFSVSKADDDDDDNNNNNNGNDEWLLTVLYYECYT